MINKNEIEFQDPRSIVWWTDKYSKKLKSDTKSMSENKNINNQSVKAQTAKIIKVKVDNWEVTVTNQDK